MALSMRDWFDEARYRRTAEQLAARHRKFDTRRFLAHGLDGLEGRELMARLARTAEAFDLALPVSLEEQLEVLRAHALEIEHNFVGIWPSSHVARRGLGRPEVALPALRDLTRYGSAEFAIRDFLVRDLEGTLQVMRGWAEHEDEHVRRLASEGSRPRLPWGRRLQALVADPEPTRSILERLRADPSLYVRKSVANHLNDIAKDHPGWVVSLASGWDREGAETAWIVRHGLRTLIKRGDPAALALVGAGAVPRLTVEAFEATPRRIRLGDTVRLSARLRAEGRRGQRWEIDYVLHYARPGGKTSEKVFKWTQVEVVAGGTVDLEKRQVIRDFSVRKHHAGEHRVELQVNGRRLAETGFGLK